jgi:SAM-dependent methyltransferase
LPLERYEELYRQGGLGVWDGHEHREDFRLIRDYLAPSQGQSLDVLDIGCYTGDLLTSLPRSFRIFGVEANAEAAKRATARGVSIVAETVEAFSGTDRKFDVITACDVIEHVPRPLEFLAILGSHVRPGGRVIVTTGDCDAWLWRLVGAGYWYCYFAEHISFVGSRWVSDMPTRAGLRLTSLTHFNSLGGRIGVARLAATALARWAPSLFRVVRRSLLPASDADEVPPGRGASRDHLFGVFETVRSSG